MGIKNILSLVYQKHYKSQHKFFQEAYEKGDAQWTGDGSPSSELVRTIKKIKPKLKLKHALDIGSGEGRHSIFLSREGFKVLGLEYQEQAIQQAMGKRRRGLLYVRGDVFCIPLKPCSFDVLIDFGVFHHIRRKDTATYLNMLQSMLVPGGYMILSCFSRKFKHANGKLYKRGYVVHKNHYDRFLTRAELRRVFGKHFNILKIKEVKTGFLDGIFQLKGTGRK
jgi:2-polyprenyl-3-methyl-5-hydroxy-6-metoxy-1,4-benzoquinol methylase